MMTHKNGIVTARKVVILFFGIFVAGIGSSVDVVVLLRYFYPVAPHEPIFDLKIFAIGVTIFFAGLGLVFTGDPLRIFTLVKSQLPGGQRRTDPPLDEEHDGRLHPRDKWRKVDPSWRTPRGD